MKYLDKIRVMGHGYRANQENKVAIYYLLKGPTSRQRCKAFLKSIQSLLKQWEDKKTLLTTNWVDSTIGATLSTNERVNSKNIYTHSTNRVVNSTTKAMLPTNRVVNSTSKDALSTSEDFDSTNIGLFLSVINLEDQYAMEA